MRASAVMFVLLGVLLAQRPGIADPGVSRGGKRLHRAVDRIQRECLRAYPPDLIARMNRDRADAIPKAVDRDPSTQWDFLNRDVRLEKGIFFPSLLETLLPAFRRHLAPGERFLDLGSGDGRVVMLAALLGAEATGIEYEADLVAVSLRAREALGDLLENRRLRFVRGDFFLEPWSGYDVVFYYGKGTFERDRLVAKLRAELDPAARLIVAHEAAPYEGFVVEAEYPGIKVYRRPPLDEPAPHEHGPVHKPGLRR